MNQSIPEDMRALVLDGVGFDHLEVKKVPTPRPGPNQMLARVDAAGICTSLIKLAEQGPDHKLMYGWDVAKHPVILGDEGSVTIVEVGENLRGKFELGSRHVIQPAIDHPPVNHLDRYRNNGEGVKKVAAGYTIGGHLAEYILVTEEILGAGCLIPIPGEGFPFSHAAMSEPISCAISAQDHHMHLAQEAPGSPRTVSKGLKPGGLAVVVGAGAMGRMHVDLALSYGPRALLVMDLIEERLERVRTLFGERASKAGIELVALNPGDADAEVAIDELSSGEGADDVIVAVGVRPVIESAQHYVGRGGVLNLFGGLKKGDDVVQLDTGLVHYGEICVTGSSGGSPWDVARTLELMHEGEIDGGSHITRIGDLDHAAEFLRMVKAQEIDGKAVVYPFRRMDGIQSVTSWSAADEAEHLKESELY